MSLVFFFCSSGFFFVFPRKKTEKKFTEKRKLLFLKQGEFDLTFWLAYALSCLMSICKKGKKIREIDDFVIAKYEKKWKHNAIRNENI